MIETSTEVTKQAALANGIPGLICLTLSIAGLVAELLFVCKKKNNFLLRLYIYLSVAVLIVHIDNTLYLIIFFYPQNGWLCEIVEAVAFYPSMVEFLYNHHQLCSTAQGIQQCANVMLSLSRI